MNTENVIRRLSDKELATTEKNRFALDVLAGFSQKPKAISSKYFYDDVGSEIFQKITQMQEYYPTRCEYEILETHSPRVSELVVEATGGEADLNVIELGAGDGHKTFLLIDQLLKDNIDFEYTPIDISTGALEFLMERFNEKFPHARAEGLVSEYFQGMTWIRKNKFSRNLVLFLGSNIGNFSRAATEDFLVRLWHVLNDGDLVLIGFDLIKEIPLLTNAYSDPHGITRDFNLNLLSRMNRELGANFEIEHFRHHAFYNPAISAMESYIMSNRRQRVYIEALHSTFDFGQGEPIHTEYSYKYSIDDIADLAAKTGFKIADNLFDDREFFVDSIWQVQKQIND